MGENEYMYLCDMCVLGMRCDFCEGAVAPCVAIFPLVRYAPTPTGGGESPAPPLCDMGVCSGAMGVWRGGDT